MIQDTNIKTKHSVGEIDKTCIWDLLELTIDGLKKNKGFQENSVVNDKFIEYGRAIPLKESRLNKKHMLSEEIR